MKRTTETEFFKNCKKIKENKISLEDFFTTLKVKTYIPVEVKFQIADKINTFISNEIETKETFSELDAFLEALDNEVNSENKDLDKDIPILQKYEIMKVFNILSAYISIEFTEKNFTEKNYDLIQETGIFNFLLNKIGTDFDRFETIVDNVTGMKYFSLTATISNILNAIPNQKKIEEVNNMMTNLSEEKIHDMLQILNFNDPRLGNLVKEIESSTMQAISNVKDNAEIAVVK